MRGKAIAKGRGRLRPFYQTQRHATFENMLIGLQVRKEYR
jgi:hypothetical protein